MKLKTSLQISGIFPIVLAILVSLGLFMRSHAIGHARTEAGVAEEMSRRLSDLCSNTYACLARGDAEGRKEWEAKHDALESFLIEQSAKGIVRKEELGDIRDKLQNAKATFTKMHALRSASGGALPAEPGSLEEYRRLEKDLATEMGSLLTLAFTFSRTTDANVASVERAVDKFFLVFVGIAALVMAGLTMSASRDVVKRLRTLNQAAGQAATGDFNLKLESVMGDELSETFHAFNEMVIRLQHVFNGIRNEREEWRKECEKGRDAATKARQANMSLADALTKLKRAQQQIVQQERLRALEQIVNGVARDFSAAITPIVSTTDFLLAYPEHLKDRKEVEENLKRINVAVRQADRQVRLLSEVFLTPGKTDSDAVDINKVVGKAIEVAKLERNSSAEPAERESICEFKHDEVPPVEGNEPELTEAVAHLLVNAVEAMGRGGKVSIVTRAEGAGVLVEVTDAGDGMTEEVRQRCLEPFFSTKGPPHSGMGLTYVVAAAGRYGGTVDIKSVPGMGTTVTLTLPVYKNGKRADLKERRKTTIEQKLKILVVDDEEYVRNILSRGLTMEGHKVETAANGQEGLKKGTEQAFDLVILDRAMPDMTGDEVAIGIRRKRPDAVILLLTGMADVMRKEGDRPKSIDAVLSKPMTLSDLHKAIAAAMRGRSQTARP